jgi:hypothetical protein
VIRMNLVKCFVVIFFVFVFVSANAGIGSITPKTKDKSSYIDVTDDWQYIEISDGKQWDGFYQDKTVHLDESFGWSVEYISPDDEIEIIERVELASPTKWILSPLDENNPAGVLSESHQILNEGRVLVTRTVWKNTGEAFSSHTVIEDDPEGEVKITVRINDRVVRSYNWQLIPKRRVIPLQ